MSFLDDQFAEVCYRARQFGMAWDESHPFVASTHFIQKRELAAARMHLECALAVYQLCRDKEIN